MIWYFFIAKILTRDLLAKLQSNKFKLYTKTPQNKF